MSKKKKEAREHRPWRDNIEAVTMAIIMAVLLKYFIIEAYKIPTGSMQPTLMGNQETGIFDRILVDKLSYHFREPARWEVAVFRYPLDRSKNFIKRICGMPEEELWIKNGDLFAKGAEESDFKPLRRPRPVQSETWKRLATDGQWRVDPSADWSTEKDAFGGTKPGYVQYPRSGSVMDRYADGYPGKMGSKLHRKSSSGQNPVGDLRVATDVVALETCSEVQAELREGRSIYRFRLPGPAAPEDARPRIEIEDGSNGGGPTMVEAEQPWRMRAGKKYSFAAQNLDDRLELDLEGDVLLKLDIHAVTDQSSRVRLVALGAGAQFEDTVVYRDIFYTNDRTANPRWTIPADSYFMLGDNTQDSADSREWRLAGFEIEHGPEAGREVRGNARRQENPRVVTGRENGPEVFFTDVYGERHHFLQNDATGLEPVEAPFVPRHLISGRALLVFWPLVPALDVYRLRWIH